jgi:hypothetical protein
VVAEVGGVGSPEVQIQNTPVLVNLLFVPVNSAPPPSSLLLGPYGGSAGQNLEAQLNLPSDVQGLVNTPLNQVMQNAWSSFQGYAQSQVQQAVQSADSRIYGVGGVSSPQQGTLLAYTTSPVDYNFHWPHSGTMLWLQYSLPGWSVHFSINTGTGGIFDPSYNLSFDAFINVNIGVPTDPSVPFLVLANFNTINFQLHDGNLVALAADILNSIATWLSSNYNVTLFPMPPLPNSQSQQIYPLPPGQPVTPGITAFLNTLTDFSTAFTTAAGLGFTSLDVGITANPPPGPPRGNTVEFVLTHPADPGPQVSNALVPSVPSFGTPQIWLDQSQVAVGQSDGVHGSSFPPAAAQASQLQVKWTNTTSGLLDHSEVRWGATSAPGVPPAQITDQTTQGNTFTATGLTPGTWYGFLVREFDAQGLIATGWSVPAVPPPADPQPWNGVWTYLQTQDTNQVDLDLYDQDSNGIPTTFVTNVGTATLQTDGTLSEPANINIPSSGVSPGMYQLVAVLSGHRMAWTPIEILAQGQAPSPLLQVMNPDNINQPYPQGVRPFVVAGSPIYLHGTNFPFGTFNLWVDNVGGPSLGTAEVLISGLAFTVQPIWPLGVTGPHNVVVDPGSPPPVPVYAESPAQ